MVTGVVKSAFFFALGCDGEIGSGKVDQATVEVVENMVEVFYNDGVEKQVVVFAESRN